MKDFIVVMLISLFLGSVFVGFILACIKIGLRLRGVL